MGNSQKHSPGSRSAAVYHRYYALGRSIGKRHRHRDAGKRLWDAVDQLRANSGLKSQENSAPVLGLIYLRFAEVPFAVHHAYTEDQLVGQPAIGLFSESGWNKAAALQNLRRTRDLLLPHLLSGDRLIKQTTLGDYQ
jgi:hypothetical protein